MPVTSSPKTKFLLLTSDSNWKILRTSASANSRDTLRPVYFLPPSTGFAGSAVSMLPRSESTFEATFESDICGCNSRRSAALLSTIPLVCLKSTYSISPSLRKLYGAAVRRAIRILVSYPLLVLISRGVIRSTGEVKAFASSDRCNSFGRFAFFMVSVTKPACCSGASAETLPMTFTDTREIPSITWKSIISTLAAAAEPVGCDI